VRGDDREPPPGLAAASSPDEREVVLEDLAKSPA
jgi:hypothetical protein